MASFLVSDDDVKNFLTLPRMDDQEGLLFSYAAPEKVLKKLLPKPLKLVAPVVCGYVVQMGKPSFWTYIYGSSSLCTSELQRQNDRCLSVHLDAGWTGC